MCNCTGVILNKTEERNTKTYTDINLEIHL